MSDARQMPSALPIAYRRLVSMALLATIYRMDDESRLLDRAVAGVLEDPLQYSMYRAVALGMAGRADDVKESLGRRVDDEPQDEAAKVTYAVSLLFAGDRQWRYWIDNVLATSADAEVRKAAYGVLTFMGNISAMH